MSKIAAGAVAFLIIVGIYLTFKSDTTETLSTPASAKRSTSNSVETVSPLGDKFGLKPSSEERVKKGYFKSDVQTPQNTSWTEIKNKFLPSAEKGDAEAIEILYASTLQCHNFFYLRGNIDGILNQLKGDDVHSSILEAYGRKLAEVQKALAESKAMCEDVPEKDVDDLVMTTVRLAAEQGDGSGQACYLAGALFGRYDSQPEDVKRAYGTEAIKIANQGLRAGNWEILPILANAFSVGQDDDAKGWIGRHIRPSAIAEYSILFLIKRGMNSTGMSTGAALQGPFVNLDGALEALKENNRLPSDDVRNAESWANEMYLRNFSQYPFPTELSPCPWQTRL